jgi:cation:H+ antiporter
MHQPVARRDGDRVSSTLQAVLSLIGLALGVAAANWGADRLADPFQKLKRQFGLTGAAGGALIAIVTASPEVGINTAAALGGANDIGLGNMLGANIISVPLIIGIGWLATRWFFHRPPEGDDDRPLRLHLERSAVTVQGLPYLVIVALVAVLTVPPAWRGLQPMDGWIMGGAFLAFYLQALLRGRGTGERASWTHKEILLALAGVVALGGGALVAVQATERLTEATGIPAVLGGLFFSATLSVAPEAIKTWVLIRIGQATAGTTSVIADNAVTMTLGFLPLALVSTAIQDFPLYAVNLTFVFIFGVLFTWVSARSARTGGVRGAHVGIIAGAYALYLALVFGVVL